MSTNPDGTGQTDAKLARRVLEETYSSARDAASERWHFLLQHAPAFITVLDPDANIVFINRVRPEFAGVQITGRSIYEFVRPESQAIVRTALAKALTSNEPVSYEIAGFGPKDEVLWYHCQVGALRRDGQFVGYMSIGTDITAQRHTEEALQMQARVLASMSEGVIVTDEHAVIMHTNTAFDAMFGYAPGELYGRHVTVLNADPNPNQPAFREAFETVCRGGTWKSEFKNIKKNGEQFVTSAHISALDLSGKRCFVSVQEDVTGRKRAEERLRQAQKLEAVGKLAGGVAHDFNHLMMLILGNCELLREGLAAQDPLCVNLDEIRKSAERAAALTSQLLAFSRKQVLQPRLINFNAVIHGMHSLLRRITQPAIELHTTLDERLEEVLADQGQIEQVVMNLALNARDAMSSGGKLFIETKSIDLTEGMNNQYANLPPGRYASLMVSDNGCGMDNATLSRLFEPYFTTKAPGKGTGLGLSTVYGIVKQSNGEVWVESAVGSGTRFIILLPVADAVARQSAQNLAAIDTPEVRGTILFAEDDEALRTLVADYLTRQGYVVLPAKDGPEALNLSARQPEPVHLLLTDVTMPKMSGPELVRRIREQRPEIKVIYMSGYTDNAAAESEIAKSAAGFVQKPITLDALRSKIYQVLHAGAKPATGSK